MKNLYTYLPKENTSHIDGVLSTRLAPEGWEKYKKRSGKLTKEEVLEWLDSLDPGFKRSNAISVLTEPIPDNAHPDILAYRDSHVLRILPNYQKLKRNGIVNAIRRINRGRKGTSETSRANYRKIDWDKIEPGKFLMSNVPHYLIETTRGKVPAEYVKESATGKLADILSRYADVKYGYREGGEVKRPTTEYFVNKYRLQSPGQLRKSKAGVCWDTSKAISEDMRRAGIPAKELYTEMTDKDGDHPSHTVPIVDDGPRGSYVVEKSWDTLKGIKRMKNVKAILKMYRNGMRKQYGDGPVKFWYIEEPIPAGSSVLEYEAMAKQREVK